MRSKSGAVRSQVLVVGRGGVTRRSVTFKDPKEKESQEQEVGALPNLSLWGLDVVPFGKGCEIVCFFLWLVFWEYFLDIFDKHKGTCNMYAIRCFLLGLDPFLIGILRFPQFQQRLQL